jgi:hypothetical protein
VGEPIDQPKPPRAEPGRRRFRLVLAGLVLTAAILVVATSIANGAPWLIAVVGGFVLFLLLPPGVIVLLHRVGLIDDEAAHRMGFLHGLGLLLLPLLPFIYLAPDSPVGYLAIPIAIVGLLFGGDVVTAMAFRLGLTNRRTILRPRTRSLYATADPGKAAATVAIEPFMFLLRWTERERYTRIQSIERLLVVGTLPFGLVAFCGVVFQVSGYDGLPLVVVGLVGLAIGLVATRLLGRGDYR